MEIFPFTTIRVLKPVMPIHVVVFLYPLVLFRDGYFNILWVYIKIIRQLFFNAVITGKIKVFRQNIPTVAVFDIPRRQEQNIPGVIPAVVLFLENGVYLLFVEVKAANIRLR
jgi:uncharacterized membrane protein